MGVNWYKSYLFLGLRDWAVNILQQTGPERQTSTTILEQVYVLQVQQAVSAAWPRDSYNKNKYFLRIPIIMNFLFKYTNEDTIYITVQSFWSRAKLEQMDK